MMYDLNWSASRIYDVLVDEGHDVAYSMIGKHRNARCRCTKDAA